MISELPYPIVSAERRRERTAGTLRASAENLRDRVEGHTLWQSLLKGRRSSRFVSGIQIPLEVAHLVGAIKVGRRSQSSKTTRISEPR